MKKLELMADFFCSPIWEISEDGSDNIQVEKLPISERLKRDLKHWADAYDETYNADDPAKSGVKTKRQAEELIDSGLKLVKRLQDEIGIDFKVTYNFQNISL